MKRLLLMVGLWMTASMAMAQFERIVFSAPGGFYDQSFYLTLSCLSPDHHIRYTTNGNAPTATSPRFEAPLLLDRQLYSTSNIYTIPISPEQLVYIPDSVQHAIVIRAAVFDLNDHRISETFTNTYLIRALENHGNDLAMLSICADSLALFDYETGILVPGATWNPDYPENTGNYFQHGKEWERQVNVEFYETADNSGINQACGLRTHGNISRVYPSKGLKIYAREEYGKPRFDHRFFEDCTIDNFKHLVIKAFSRNWPKSGTQNYITNQLALGLHLEAAHSRPVILFINGEYWGLYFLQEKLDECYLEDHFGIDNHRCNIIGNWKGEVENGTNKHFNEMMQWFEHADLSMESNYERLCRLIDLENYIDYMILETYILNTDWPGNNMRCWQEDDGPWRWMFFDGDQSLVDREGNIFETMVYTGTDTWTNSTDATLLFRRLLESNTFKERFSLRLHELCQGILTHESTSAQLRSIIGTMQPEIENQQQRFGYPLSLDYWNWGNSLVDDFLIHRNETYLQQFEDFPLFKPIDHPLHTNDFICFPNPVANQLKIMMLDGRSRHVVIQVCDLLGNVLLQEEDYLAPNAIHSIGLEALHPGLYFVKIGSSAQKLLIQQ